MSNFNFNQVVLGGRLTATPELKQTQSGLAVTSFGIAVKRKGNDAGTDFIDCVAWRKTAEMVCQYFKKGSALCVIGSLQKREYTDKSGNKRYITEVVAQEVSFVDSKAESAASPDFGAQEAPNFGEQEAPNFEDIPTDDPLPF